jgi:cytochrome P450
MIAPELDDMFAPAAIADPYRHYARLRELDPVHWNDRYQLWVVTRYHDIVWMIRHHELFSSAVIRNDPRPPYPPVDPADLDLVGYVRQFRADQLVEHDRPQHLAMRQVVHGYFTPRTMESWRPFVRQAVTELLDEAEARGRMDVLTDLAAPLPVRVITQMMSVPPEDREHLRELADKLLYINRGEPDRLRPLTEGMRGMIEYVEPLVEARLRRPGADFISVLAQGEQSGVLTRRPGHVGARHQRPVVDLSCGRASPGHLPPRSGLDEHGGRGDARTSARRTPMSTITTKDGAQIFYKVYKGFPHGMATTHHDVINTDLLAFVKA